MVSKIKFYLEFLVKTLILEFKYYDPTPIETLLSLSSVWFILILLLPGRYLQILALGKIIPEIVWIILFSLLTLWLTLGRILMNLRIEKNALLFSIGLWTFVSIIFFQSKFLISGGIYFLYAMASAWAHWRLGK